MMTSFHTNFFQDSPELFTYRTLASFLVSALDYFPVLPLLPLPRISAFFT